MDDYLWSATARDPVDLRWRLQVSEGHGRMVLRLRLEPLDLGGQSLPEDLAVAPTQVSVDLVFDRRVDAFQELDREVGPLCTVPSSGRS